MSQDKFRITEADQPATEAFAITPNDSADLTYTTRSLYVGSAGDIVVDMYGPVGGADAMSRNIVTNPMTVTFKNVPAGAVLPICVRRVRATNTTAGSLVGLL